MNQYELLTDPIKFTRLCWPDIRLYDRQVDILRSVQYNDETIVPAGNELGKDFVAGLCALWFFCSRSPCRVVTSSSGQTQLKSVLWGEIRRFIATSKYPLPIQYPINDQEIKQVIGDQVEPRSYLRGIVTNVAENLQGHHLEWGKNRTPRTLWLADEASSIATEFYNAADTWAHRILVIGNPLPCTNFFFNGVKGGDIKASINNHYERKILRIKAEESPNIRLAQQEIAQGKEPSLTELVPGVVDYPTYTKRRKLWDKVRQCVGLDAEFYEGATVLLYPPDWLNRAEGIAANLVGRSRKAEAMGVDPAEGGDSSVWTVIDKLGIIEQVSKKTPNTTDIPDYTIMMIKKYNLPHNKVLFDRGGGGKQHADYLRRKGYKVRSVGFGEAATNPDNTKRMKTANMKDDAQEIKYTYKNRRAEMYGIVRFELLDPLNEKGFGIPQELVELRRQMAVIPLLWDEEGRLRMLPKTKKANSKSDEDTLVKLIGHSPDECDSFVLAAFGMLRKQIKNVATAA